MFCRVIGEFQRLQVLVPAAVVSPDELGYHCFNCPVGPLYRIAMGRPNRRRPVFYVERPEHVGQCGRFQLCPIIGDDNVGTSVPVNNFVGNAARDGIGGSLLGGVASLTTS